MSLHSELLTHAQHLARSDPRRPKQVSLRRAVSTAYYALFHLLVTEASSLFVKKAAIVALLNRTYSHDDMNKVSKAVAAGKLPSKLNAITTVPPELRNVAETFVVLQQARHEADYNLAKNFTRSEAASLVGQVAQAFRAWEVVRKQDCARLFLGCFLLWDTWEKKIR